MKKYEIKSAVGAIRQQLTVAQRTSSLFSEAPQIGGKILRRGVSLILEEAQYLFLKSKIDAMVKAGAVTVTVVGEDGKLTASVTVEPSEVLSEPKVSGKVSAPEEGVISPQVQQEAAELVKEVVSEVSAQVSEPETSAQAQTSEPVKRGRKPNQPK